VVRPTGTVDDGEGVAGDRDTTVDVLLRAVGIEREG
jgi:hypothetical protein